MKKHITTRRILKSVIASVLALALVVTGLPSTMLEKLGFKDANNVTTVQAATTWVKESLPTTAGATLQDKHIYTVTDTSPMITAGAGKNGLVVAGGATVIIYIKAGKTLTVKGGDGSGSTGGGAGIYVPSNSTLIITGEGTLNAIGGKAGSGSTGGTGGSGTVSTESYYQGGAGGNGGAGGGGAGAGIGGYGGTGGSGGSGGSGSYETNGASNSDGSSGYPGSSGSTGASSGTIYIVGTVSVTASGGGQGSGASGGSSGSKNYSETKWNDKQYHVAGAGGGGGGGGGGAAAAAIGGGAGGGAGGGGGGGGATDYRASEKWNTSWPTNQTCQGGGGSGASYGGSGGSGTRDTGKDGDSWSRAGGSGGSAGSSVGSSGSSGSRYRTSTASVNNTSGFGTISNNSNLPAAVKYTLTYINERLSENNSETKNVYIGYGFETPSSALMPDNFTGYEFQGFYTAQNGGGVRVIDENGQVLSGTIYTDETIWLWPDNVTLYAYYKPKTYIHTLVCGEADDPGAAIVDTTYDQAVPSTRIQIPLKTNSVFLGYYTGENGTGTQLIDGTGAFVTDESVSEYINANGQWIYDGDLTLYADWLTLSGTPVASEILKLTVNPADNITYYYGKVSLFKDGETYQTDRVELKQGGTLYRMSANGDGTHTIAARSEGSYEILVDGVDTGYTLELTSTDEDEPSTQTLYAITASVVVNIDRTAYNNGLVELKDDNGDTKYALALDEEGRYIGVGFFTESEDDTSYEVYVDGKATGESLCFTAGSNEKTIDFYSFSVLTMIDDAVASLDSTLTLETGGDTIVPDSAVGGSYSYLGRDESAVYEIYLGGVSTGQNVTAGGTAVIKYYTTTIRVTRDGEPCDATDIYLYKDGTEEADLGSAKLIPTKSDTGVYTIRYTAEDELYHICVNGQEYERTVNFNQKNTVNAAFTALRVTVKKDGAAYDPEEGVSLKAGSILKVLERESEGSYYTYVYSTNRTVYDVITGTDETGIVVQASAPTCTVDYYTLTLDAQNGTLDEPTEYVQLKDSTLGLSDKIPTCNDSNYPEFAGWYQSASGAGEKVTEYTFTDKATLYAKYSKGLVPYTVNYYVPNMESNDEEEYVLAARENGKIEVDKTIGFSENSPDVLIKDQLAEDGELYNMHLLFDHSSIDDTGKLTASRESENTIDVYYSYEQVSLSYSVTGGIAANEALTTAMAEATHNYNYGTVITLIDPLSFMEEGKYTVDGWKDSTGNYYTGGQKVTLNGDFALTATFEETYKVTYQQNGGNVGFTTEPQPVYDEETGEYKSAIRYDEETGKYYDANTDEELVLDTQDQVHAVAKNSTIEVGLDSQKDGLILSGWWLLDDAGEKTDTFFSASAGPIPTYTVNQDTTLKARWIATITQPVSRLYTVVPLSGYDPTDVEEGTDYSFYLDYVGTSFMTDEGYVATSLVEDADETQMQKLTPETRTITVNGQEKEVEVYTIENVSACQYLTVSGVKYKVSAEGVTVSDIPDQEYAGGQLKPAITVSSALGTMSKGEDYTLTYGDNIWTGEANAGSITITGKGDYTGVYTVYFEIVDTELPSISEAGEGITISTSNWRSFLNVITFGLFFKNTETVTIKASDSGSGIKNISYLLSERETVYTQEELEAIPDEADRGEADIYWKNYTRPFQISPEFKGLIYARITDKAGKTLYINTDGLVFFHDPAFDTSKITYHRERGEDVAIPGSLYNNTIESITLTRVEEGGEDGAVVPLSDTESHYTDGTGIMISNTYLDSLVNGTYRIDITVLPLGVQTEHALKYAVPLEIVDHIIVTDNAVPATCTEPGLTEGSHCSSDLGCGQVFVSQIEVPALGHDWPDDWTVVKEATATENGRKEKICAREGCGQKKYEIIPKTGTSDELPENVRGKLEKDAEVAKEAPIEEATLDNKKSEILNAPAIFTEVEKQQIENNGLNAKVWLEVTKTKEENLSEENKTKVEEKAKSIMGDNPTLTYFDADLFKQIDGGTKEPIHEPGIDIKVTIRIPENLRNPDHTKIRTYKIIRLHTDEAGISRVDVLNGTFDETTGEFTFATDKFSTYALVYTDYSQSGGSASGGNTKPKDPVVAPPQTFDKNDPKDIDISWQEAKDPKQVTMDDKPLDPKDYKPGNKKLTLPKDYLDGLEPGDHTVTIYFDDGTSQKVVITIAEKQEPKPDQPDKPTDSGDTNIIVSKTFHKLPLVEAKATKNAVKVSWKKVTGADGYVLYGAPCNTKDKTYKMKKLAVIKNGSKVTYTDKKLKAGTYYKYYIKAYKLVNGKKVWLAQSKVIHVTTSGGKYGNAKAVKVNSTNVTLKKGKSLIIKASQIAGSKPIKQHADIKYESTNTKIATVTKNGRIKAKKKGICYIYVYAQNGMYKRIKVTVK